MKVIAVVNQKGGVAKTTTTANLGAALAARGQRTLLLDLDPQANLTFGLGADTCILHYTLADVLADGGKSVPLAAVVQRASPDVPLYLAPGHASMARHDSGGGAAAEGAPLHHLRTSLDAFARDHEVDWVVIDCPPSLGLLARGAVVASRHLLVPTQPAMYAFAGIDTLNRMVQDLSQQSEGERADLLGVLLTLVERNTRLHRTVSGVIRERLGDRVFDTVIPKSVRVAEAELEGRPVRLSDPAAPAARAYDALAGEVLARSGGAAPA